MSKKAPALATVFFALADPTRLEVVTLLGHAPRRASDLAESVGASRPGMSRHLRVLREAGLVHEEDDETDGRARRWLLDPSAFDRVRDFLDETEGFWSAQLGAFKRVAEAHASEGRGATKRSRRAS